MKKLLTVILLVCLATSLFAAVDMRMRVVDSQLGQGVGNPEYVTVAIEILSSYAYNILTFKGAFYVGDELAAALTSSPITDAGLFPGAQYSVTTQVVSGRVQFKYNLTGSATTLTAGVWTEVLRVQLNYLSQQNGAATPHTQFIWDDTDATYLYTVEVDVIGIPISVTGGRQSVPNDLDDFSLPVLLSAFDVNYSYENGSFVTWTCGSQQNCEQFILKRSTDGINWEEVYRVDGEGTTTNPKPYSYYDESAQAGGVTYIYQLYEVIEGTSGPNAIALVPVQTLAAPTQFNLAQNFPNPFNPKTKIPFEILNDSHVSLKVYNLLGQEVKSLIDHDMSAGVYDDIQQPAFEWDGTNNQNVQLPSGVYLYKLKAGDNVQVRKMTKLQ